MRKLFLGEREKLETDSEAVAFLLKNGKIFSHETIQHTLKISGYFLIFYNDLMRPNPIFIFYYHDGEKRYDHRIYFTKRNITDTEIVDETVLKAQ